MWHMGHIDDHAGTWRESEGSQYSGEVHSASAGPVIGQVTGSGVQSDGVGGVVTVQTSNFADSLREL